MPTAQPSGGVGEGADVQFSHNWTTVPAGVVTSLSVGRRPQLIASVFVESTVGPRGDIKENTDF